MGVHSGGAVAFRLPIWESNRFRGMWLACILFGVFLRASVYTLVRRRDRCGNGCASILMERGIRILSDGFGASGGIWL